MTTAVTIAPTPILSFLNNQGQPCVGGTVLTQVGGVNTATYQDSAGATPLPNPIPLNNRGEISNASGVSCQLFLQTGVAYVFTLFDANGNQLNQAGYVTMPNALATNLASTLAGQGAALVGSNDAGNYFNGATVEAILQEIGNPKAQFQLDGINVLRYIPPAEWAAIIAGTSTTDLVAYLQAALTAEPNLIFPDGLFNTSAKLIPRIDSRIHGINRRATKLRATAAITILEYPINNVDCVVENIFFVASIAGATGIACANTAGANHDYLIRPHVKFCDFAWELAYGINASLIYSTIELSTFGYYGTVGSQPAPGASTMVALRSYNAASNSPNLNRVNDCNINAGSTTQAAVDISGGVGWVFTDTDWSYGGRCVAANNIAMLKFRGTCWAEGNNSTTSLFNFGATTVPVDVDGLNISNNTCADVYRITSGGGGTAGLNIRNTALALNSPSFVLFDTATGLNTLPADGSVAFYGNVVSGGNAANKIVTGTEFRGGKTSPRLTLAGITTTPGTISGSNDPGAIIFFNGVGDVSVSGSHPFATSAAKVVAIATPNLPGFQVRVQVTNTTTVRVQIETAAGAPVDGTFSLVVSGS